MTFTASAYVHGDQRGRRFIITGATSGIGLEAARTLAMAGAHVVMAVRNLDKGRAVADDLGGDVAIMHLDVSSLSSVREFVACVGAAYDHVDVVINNAGVLGLPLGFSADGVEETLATNHLGHFALTEGLLPLLTDRVVITGSQSHRHGTLDVDDLHWQRRGYKPYAAYAQSKLANMLHLLELHTRLSESGSQLRVVAAHPGYTKTAIQTKTSQCWFNLGSHIGNAILAQGPVQGAAPTIEAATADLPGNTYLGPARLNQMRGRPVPVDRAETAWDLANAARLHRWSLDQINAL